MGDRIAIISAPGGAAVSAAEACGKEGLSLAELSAQTTNILANFIPPIGTSLRNPIDLGLTGSLQMEMYIQATLADAKDPGVDAGLVLAIGVPPEANRQYTDSMIKSLIDMRKPLVMVNIQGFDPALPQKFCEAGVPFFESSERAMRTYSKMLRYQLWRQKKES